MTFFNCKTELNKSANKTIFYPSKEFFEKQKVVEIDLEKTNMNFKEIIHFIDGNQSQRVRAFVAIKENNITRKIIPFVDNGGYRKMKNVLQIKEDSILIDDNYPIKDLNKILARHYENNGKILKYSDSPKRASIELTIDTSSNGSDLKKILLTLTKEFDILNANHMDSLELNIFFDYFRQMSIPVQPPPPIE